MDREYFGLGANRQYQESARAALDAYEAMSLSERAKGAAEQASAEENAGYQGAVTIQQAEATYIDLNIRAFSGLAEHFCQFIPLQIGEVPIYKYRQDYEVRINMGHLAGGPPMVKFQTVQSGVQVTPFQYFSEEILVPNLVNASFNIGKFHEKEKALARIANDMAIAKQQYIINTLLSQPLSNTIAASLAAYYVSTPYVGRTPYLLDNFVDPGSVETTNILNVVVEGGLTRNVFRAIRSQSILQQRTAKSLFIPVTGKPWEAYWNQASIVAAQTGASGNANPVSAIPPSKWAEAADLGFSENGQSMSWFGMNLWIQPINLFPQGYFLVATDAPALMGWDQLDMAISDEDPLGGKDRQLAKRYEARSIALAQADTQLRAFIAGKMQ
jgi:hypothetical protein